MAKPDATRLDASSEQSRRGSEEKLRAAAAIGGFYGEDGLDSPPTLVRMEAEDAARVGCSGVVEQMIDATIHTVAVREIDRLANLVCEEEWEMISDDGLEGTQAGVAAEVTLHPNQVQGKAGDSDAWRRMLWARQVVEPQATWDLVAWQVSFWWDNWVGEGPLAWHFPHLVGDEVLSQYLVHGRWDFGRLKEILSDHILKQIVGLVLCSQEGEQDVLL